MRIISKEEKTKPKRENHYITINVTLETELYEKWQKVVKYFNKFRSKKHKGYAEAFRLILDKFPADALVL